MTSSQTTVVDAPTGGDALRARSAELQAAEPRLRIRDRALRLGVSEAELVAAGAGVEAVALAGTPQALVGDLGALGRVMALSRNDWCVHERHGRYEDIQAEGMVGIVLGPDIDLRLFFADWARAWVVTENGRRSLQFFDREGVAVHKVYRTDATDAAAWDAYVARHAAPADAPAFVPQAIVVRAEAERVADPAALRERWLALKDTHDFHPLLRSFKVKRIGALRAAGDDLAQDVGAGAAEAVLTAAAASGQSIMCFLYNRCIVQIHSGPVHKLARTGRWFNVLDPEFNLHLDTEAITSCWVVCKPTSDGWVTSLEVYGPDDVLIVQFFGERKPGKPELTEWRELLRGLCAKPIAA